MQFFSKNCVIQGFTLHFLWYGGVVMDAQVYLHFINHGCGNVVIAAVSWGIILSSINPWRHIGISTTSGN